MLKHIKGRLTKKTAIQKPPDPVSEFPQLDSFWQTTEVSAARFFINDLFVRKYRSEAPTFGRHWISFYKTETGAHLPVSYIHASLYGPLVLIGGVMTDGEMLKQMNAEHRDAILEAGGCYYTALRHVFMSLSDQCEAFVGLIADPRSMEVSCAAGFEPADSEPAGGGQLVEGQSRLVIYCPKPVSPKRRRELIDFAMTAGPF